MQRWKSKAPPLLKFRDVQEDTKALDFNVVRISHLWVWALSGLQTSVAWSFPTGSLSGGIASMSGALNTYLCIFVLHRRASSSRGCLLCARRRPYYRDARRAVDIGGRRATNGC
jgi:hypothetical protein